MTTVETDDICAPADGAVIDSGSRRMQTMRQLNKSKTNLSRTVCSFGSHFFDPDMQIKKAQTLWKICHKFCIRSLINKLVMTIVTFQWDRHLRVDINVP